MEKVKEHEERQYKIYTKKLKQLTDKSWNIGLYEKINYDVCKKT